MSLALLALLALAAPVPSSTVASFCGRCSAAKTVGWLAPPKLKEASGLAASAVHPGVYYVHNDSGDKSRFFAIDERGRDLGSFTVAKTPSVDWEDIAVGPCEESGGMNSPAERCIYIADTGDNNEGHDAAAIIRLREPATIGPGHQKIPGETFRFRYPDGPHDAEALLVHPRTGVLTLVTKQKKGPASIYELVLPAHPADAAVRVSKVGQLTPPVGLNKVTGGSASASGLLLRTYSHVLYYPWSLDSSVASGLLGVPCAILGPPEPSGEAISWLPDGSGFLTVSEGLGAELHRTSCSP